MKRTRHTSTLHSDFKMAWNLYQNAFPSNEKRELDIQEVVLKHEDYHFEVIHKDEEFIGFIAWWQFDGLKFIEHFATLDLHRGKGYGKSILLDFIAESPDNILLEVEPPTTEMNQRRIGFYERLGFILNLHPYQQLPLRKQGELVDLLVMTIPNAISEDDLKKFKRDFKKKCYDDVIGD